MPQRRPRDAGRRGRPTGDEAARIRHAMLDAAVAAFLERGYDRATLSAIADAAGVSTATLYKHYPTKADLFGGVMARFWDNEPGDTPPLPNPGDPRRGLTVIGRHYARLLTGPDAVALFRVIIAEAPRFPELGRELYQRGKQPYLDRLRVYLTAECGAGTLRIDDLPTAKRQFLGMINDVVFWPRLLITDLRVSRRESYRVVDGAVETFMRRYRA